jgi:hypothetical protein
MGQYQYLSPASRIAASGSQAPALAQCLIGALPH